MEVVFAQPFSRKRSLELFVNKANVAARKELEQIHSMDTYKHVHKSDLTFKNGKKALASLFVIAEKRNGDIWARNIIDVSKHRTHDGYDKSDGSSPTVITIIVFLTGVLDAAEKRAVAIIDISNAFLHTENNDKILMLVRVRLAEIMVQVDPAIYPKYVIHSPNGQAML